ncbi:MULTISPECIES: segregation and condensation protein A [Mogibacterium]|uniref:Segregation and condensation protein A n=1 Tax=Mogibacterium timidum ATCC 33093 TaxID=1401079 RepID=X8IQX9_9FIRM|nr:MULTISPECIES: segregation/condensation protein A [Mogibacterium]EJU20299.1 ScpA/B protein [Mogibacterium sp. CM50]EUC51456.1 ScpA/B protein [Mogibacterium timidum ATCC 33093]
MYKVRIDKFEGPFDLLVYLIQNAKMDIYDIRVAEITEQYIAYLKEMGELNVEVSSEFIVLAAVLIRLKSRMLLPRVNEIGEIVIDEDPRMELASRLAEYVRTKKIAEMLQERMEANECVHEKPAEDMSIYIDSPDELLKTDIEQFVSAFNAFLQKKKRVADVKKRYQRIKRDRASIEERINYMSMIIKDRVSVGESIDFARLVPEDADRYDVTLSFMSLLEMIKMQEVDAKQDRNYGNISVIKKEVQTDVQR